MLGEKLMILRKKKGYSQQDVADILEVSRQTISNWESEQGAPTLDKAKQLAEIYKVSLDDLIENNIEFVSVKKKELSPILTSLINKRCIVDGSLCVILDGVHDSSKVRIIDVGEEWIKVEYERVRENALFKKEKVIKYLDLEEISAFQLMEEE